MDKRNHDLYRLGKAGCCFFDVNMDFLEEPDWSTTKLGARDQWPSTLSTIVNLSAALPHPAAVFWKSELDGELYTVQNLSFEKAIGNNHGQGLPATKFHSPEALHALRSCLRGRSAEVGHTAFYSHQRGQAEDAPLLLAPIHDNKGTICGVFAQLMGTTDQDEDMDYIEIQEVDDETDKNSVNPNMHGMDGNESKKDREEAEHHEAKNEQKKAEALGNEEEAKELKAEAEGKKAKAENGQSNEERSTKESPESKEQTGQREEPNQSSNSRKGSSEEQTGPKMQKLNLRQNRLFRNFAQMLPTGLAVLNPDAEALFVNQEFFRLTTDREDPQKSKGVSDFRSWPDSIHEEDYERVMQAYRDSFNTMEPLRVEFRCRTADRDLWRMVMMKSIEEQPDKGGFIVAVIDISEMKAAELAQRQAAQEAVDRKEQQERFIDMISHEIRNPLSAILHSAEEIKDLISDDTDEDGKAQVLDAIDTILLCVAHQSTLVDDILSFSKLDAMMLTLSPRKARPKESLAECLKLFQPELRAKKIDFEYALDVSFVELSVDWVLADLKRIKQVLVNLMTNAIKFTARGTGEKKIMVGVGASAERPTSYPPNVVFFDPGNDEAYKFDSTTRAEWGDLESLYIMVSIKDSGIGISELNQTKLFERFRQATPKTAETYGGSGLGLFISRKLCQLHGGEIGCSSHEGSGSTFGFFFKVRRTEAPTDAEDPEETSQSLSEQAGELLSHHADRGSEESDSSSKEKAGHKMGGRSRGLSIASNGSLSDPDVRVIAEAHPSISNTDQRYQTTHNIANKVRISSHEKNRKAETNKDSQDENATSRESGSPDPPKTNTSKQGQGPSSHKTAEKDKPEEKKSPSRSPDKGKQTRRSLLLVEDNQINSKVLTRQLSSRGFDVTPAYNGQEAVDALKDGLSPEIILMDQEMPILSGNGATKAIRQLESEGKIDRHIPILGVSANVREEHTTAMRAAGMDDVIPKPFKVDDLVYRINSMFSSSENNGP